MTHKQVTGACLALLIGASFASASTITFTESAVASGMLGNNSFVNSLITLTATGDTSNVTPRGPGWFWLSGLPVSINIASLGTTATLTSAGIVGSCHDNSCPTTSQALVGFYDPTADRDILDTFSGAFNTYDLTTWIGPITGSSRINASTAFNTNKGSFQITSAGASTFTATVQHIIVNQQGATNPASNGFALNVGGGVTSQGPAGTAAWNVQGEYCCANNWYYLSASQITDLNTATNWAFIATFQNLSPSTGPGYFGWPCGYGSYAVVQVNGVRFDLVLNSDGRGNQLLCLNPWTGSPAYTIAGLGTNFVTLEVLYNNSTMTADIFINGKEVISNYAGHTPLAGYTSNIVAFGGQNGTFSQVELETNAQSPTPLPAIGIPVANFSFETLPPGGLPYGCAGGSGCAYSWGLIPGWTNSGMSGQWQPGSNTLYFNYIPDGITVAYSNDAGGAITQSVGTVTANTTYTLRVDVGLRKDGYDSLGTVALLIGSTPVYATGVAPTIGNWSTFTATYSAVPADIGKPLTVQLTATGNQSDFDNVRLNAVTAVTPSAPTLLSPSHGATNLATSQNLTWSAAAGATAYDVYFGTNNPPPLYARNLTVTTLAVGPLMVSTTYYWKVTAKNSAGSTDSAVFSFTVGSAIPALTSIAPTRGVVGSTVTITLAGTNFVAGQTSVAIAGANFGFHDVTVGSVAVTLSSSASSTLTTIFTISATAAVGPRDVTVTTPSGTSNPVTFTIDPRSSGGTRYSITDKGGFSLTTDGSDATIQVGYARIQPDSGNTVPAGLAVFGYRQGNVLVSEAAVPASPLIQSGRIFAEVNGPVNTGVAIANPNPLPVSINFYLTRVDGTASPSSTTTIPANGQIATFLDQAPFNVVAPFIGTFTFSSSSPVSVIALRGLVNERSEFLITTLPVTDLTASTGQTLMFPHFADGGGWTSQIILMNPTDQRLTGTVQFFDQGSASIPGAPLNLTVEGRTGTTFSYSVEARSSQRLRTSGQGTDTQSGSVHLVPDVGTKTPSGLLVFSYRRGGITVSEAGVPNVPSGSVFRLYAEASSNFQVQTGVGVANASPSPVSVAFELTNLAGQSTGLSGSTVVPGNGQAAMFLNQIPGFSTLPTPFQGVLRIVGPASGISVVGLRGRTNERGDFLITTTSPVDESGTASSTEWLFPHIVDSGGYSTQLILFSGLHGQSATGTLQFVSQSGADLNLHFKDKNPGTH